MDSETDKAGVNANVAFAMEVLVFVSLGVWSWQHGIGDSIAGKWVLTFGVLAISIALWALFVSPKSIVEIPALELLFRLLITALGVLAFASLTTTIRGVLIAIIAGLSFVFIYVGPFAR